MFRIGRLSPDLAPVFQQMAVEDLEFAKRLTITRVSAHVHRALTAELKQVVRNPNPYTQRAVRRRAVRPDGRPYPAQTDSGERFIVPQGQPFAMEVYLLDEKVRGSTPPATYLKPLVYGGDRSIKRSESALRKIGVLASTAYAIPGIGARRDGHGDISGGQAREVLSYLRAAQLTAGSEQNTGRRKRAAMAKRGIRYFVSSGPGKGRLTGRNRKLQHLHAGIYRTGPDGRITPVFVFTTNQPTYRAVFDFVGVGDAAVAKHYDDEFKRAFQQALRARRRSFRQ